MAIERGIILAGGSGTRLHPMTKAVSKQLLPVYDKPMIYYPLTLLMLMGVREFLVITTSHDLDLFQRLLGWGKDWGVGIRYAVQPEPKGIAQAITIAGAKGFLGDENFALILGDNLFFGHDLPSKLRAVGGYGEGAYVFGYHVSDPSAYGVAEISGERNGSEVRRVISIEEKPAQPRSQWAVSGLYFYDETAYERALALKPSARGELEITDLNRSYMDDGRLFMLPLGRGIAWLDTGTASGMLQASEFVATLQTRQAFYIASPEEAAFRNGWLSPDQLAALASKMGKTAYADYLARLATGG